MASHGIDVETLASRAGVDPKTVERWLSGRTPHTRHRWAAAALLREDETYLWPQASSLQRYADASNAELIKLYPHRSDVPAGLWWNLLTRARERIDVLAYAALFLPEQHLGLVKLLDEKCRRGCQVRIALGDPLSSKVAERGVEEQFGEGIVSRVKLALKHYDPLRSNPNASIRVHGTTLYNSIFRFDDEMLVNTHVWGLSAYGAPALHLRRIDGGGVFDTYARSFELVWSVTRALPASPPERASTDVQG
jgi:transcriptional regulator with XRE-family HTH domain